jgi:hypothetical protein
MDTSTSSNSTLATRLEGTCVWEYLLPYISTVSCNISQLLPRFNPPQIQALLPPPIHQQFIVPFNPNQQQQVPINANQHPKNQASHNPPKPTTIPAQPIPNPNNRPTHPMQNAEVQTFPTYEIQLRSRKAINQSNPGVVIQEENDKHSEEENTQTTLVEEETSPPIPITSHSVEVPQQVNLPPYPEILLVKKPNPPLHKDIEDELQNVCKKIPLLKAIKDIPVYAKIIRDICIKKP